MNKQRHKHADLIIAWANCAEIEYFDGDDNQWWTIASPSWHLGFKFRIKPKKVEKWQWVAKYCGRPLYITQHLADDELSVFEGVEFIQKIDSTKITVEE
ncbi:MAG TPA: hypothetical protein VFM18_09950 [Methanosarcina sp.]|nr:hypothetical protein [Methanosarcina sp.]